MLVSPFFGGIVGFGMKSIQLEAPAKLNLFFEVLGKRPDGYHEIVTITTPVSLFDTLIFEESTEEIDSSE